MKERLRAIKYALLQRVKGGCNWNLNRFQRWFYTFKAIVCLSLGLHKHFDYSEDVVDMVATWDSSRDYWGDYDWTELAVGYGYFKNWRYDIYSNGT